MGSPIPTILRSGAHARLSGRHGARSGRSSGGTGSASYYGACDLGGNVLQWNETIILSSNRGLRGGSWSGNENNLRSSNRNNNDPDIEGSSIGFRIASP